MKFLVSNDDGIDALGLDALVAAASRFGESVIVAPALPQSGMSHTVTCHELVRVEERGKGRFAVFGTPADCARIGLLKLAPDAKWVLSGINHGGNLGADVYYSGTVAAVREAVLHGWPGVAVSHYFRESAGVDWARASEWTAAVLADLFARPVETGLFYNVNLPHLEAADRDPEVVFCPLDSHPLPLSYRHEEGGGLFYDGKYQMRERAPGADVDCCFRGNITITTVRLF